MPEVTPTPSKKAVFWRRTTSTLGLWAVVAAAFSSRLMWAYLASIAALGLLATVEYFRMLKTGGVKSFPRFGVLLAVVYSVPLYGSLAGRWTLPPLFDAAAVFIALAGAFILQLRYPIRGLEALQSVAANLLGFVYVAVLFNFSARLIVLAPPGGAQPGWEQVPGAMLLLWMIAVTKFTDMGAYITGSLIGRNKMIPHVSPGKTWEGFGGALVFAQLAACGLYALFPAGLALLGGWSHVVTLGFLLALLAVVGDLAESVVKRSLGVKDSGNLLPGIGGALDLIDSLCFTAPALYFYLMWMPR